MHITDFDPAGAPVTGRKVLLIIVTFFGVIIAVNMTMLYLALNNFSGLVVKNSYVASQRFEADRARAQAAALSKWRIEKDARAGAITLRILDADGAPVPGIQLHGVVGRRSHDRQDQPVSFSEIAPGLYRAEQALAPGAWRLKLRDAATPDVERGVELDVSAAS